MTQNSKNIALVWNTLKKCWKSSHFLHENFIILLWMEGWNILKIYKLYFKLHTNLNLDTWCNWYFIRFFKKLSSISRFFVFNIFLFYKQNMNENRKSNFSTKICEIRKRRKPAKSFILVKSIIFFSFLRYLWKHKSFNYIIH